MASVKSVRFPVASAIGMGVLAEVYLASTQQPVHWPQKWHRARFDEWSSVSIAFRCAMNSIFRPLAFSRWTPRFSSISGHRMGTGLRNSPSGRFASPSL